MPKLCRFDAHLALASLLSGVVYEVDTLDCTQPARHTDILSFEPIPGVIVRIDTDVCDEHEATLARSRHHKRSTEIRT